MAVAVCPPVLQSQSHIDRYYSIEGTPSPQSVVYYPELDDEAFQSDEEIQKVREE